MKKILYVFDLTMAVLTAAVIFWLSSQSVAGTQQLTNLAINSIPAAFSGGGSNFFIVLLDLNNPRKVAHIYEYYFFGLFTVMTIVFSRRKRSKIKIWLLATSICVAFSLADQVHKIFVPGREFDFSDMLLDCFGYSVAICSLLIANAIYDKFNKC